MYRNVFSRRTFNRVFQLSGFDDDDSDGENSYEEDNDGSGNYQDHDNGDHRNVGVDDDSDGNDDDADGNDDEDDEEC